jgi:hypothetical protein
MLFRYKNENILMEHPYWSFLGRRSKRTRRRVFPSVALAVPTSGFPTVLPPLSNVPFRPKGGHAKFFLTSTVDLMSRERVSQAVQRITTDDRPSRRALKGRYSYNLKATVGLGRRM